MRRWCRRWTTASAAWSRRCKEIGQYDNTLIVFASDNGCAGYILGACSNAPLYGYKRYHHEGGVRIPLIMSWPAKLAAGRTFTDPVITLDLMATFTAAAGSPVATEDSVNLLPFLSRGEDLATARLPLLALGTHARDPRQPMEADPLQAHRPARGRRHQRGGRPHRGAAGRLADGGAARPDHAPLRPAERSGRDDQRGRGTSGRGGPTRREARRLAPGSGAAGPAPDPLHRHRDRRRMGTVPVLMV